MMKEWEKERERERKEERVKEGNRDLKKREGRKEDLYHYVEIYLL